MSELQKPLAGICTACHAKLEGDQIFHWSPTSWSVWCFPCYKAEHFTNLRRVQQDAGECEQCHKRMEYGGYRHPVRMPDDRVICTPCSRQHPSRRFERD